MKSGNYLLYLFFLSILASGCKGVRHLEDGEKLLHKQSIIGVEEADKDALYEQITLVPNTRIPILGPLGASIYETGEDNLDTAEVRQARRDFIDKIDKKIADRAEKKQKTGRLTANKRRRLERFQNKLRNGNLFMRSGTPLAVYDSTSINISRDKIETELNYRGFLKAEVSIELKEKKRKIHQKFVVEEGPRSNIDSLTLNTGDSLLSNLVNENKAKSFLKIGDPYNKYMIDQERQRIESLLKDAGYLNFSKNFIQFNVYFRPNEKDLWISTNINKPADQPTHQVFQLDSVVFNTNGNDIPLDTTEYENITYIFGLNDYSEKVLDTRLIFRKGDLYSYTDVINTQRQLLAIDNFRYVNINFDTTLVPGKMLTNIYTAPLKKYQITQELGLNVNANANANYPGPFYNLSFKDRNIFNGLENLEFNGFIGFEGIAQQSGDREKPYPSLQYGGSLSLSFPRFITPFKSRQLNLDTFNPRTSVSLGYSYIDRPEYKRETINGNLAYNWQNLKGNKNYTFTLSDVNLIYTPSLDSAFQQQLDQLANQGNTLGLAFDPSFVTSTSFNASINNNYSNPLSPSSFFRYFVEAGGSVLNITGKGLLDNNNLTDYQFVKFQFDYRRYYPLSNERALVLRTNLGLANPYNGIALPYEKYFFTGGSNSNRAWTPRRLGPGSAFPYLIDENGNNVRDSEGNLVPDRTENSYRFEQPGEILLEMNAEYRANIASFVDWAFFIDAGNIWRLEDTQLNNLATAVTLSPGADFELSRFYKEIAVGVGLGLRLDFSFLVFRFDIGHKVRDPRFPDGERWRKPFQRANQTVWNIAVGYAF